MIRHLLRLVALGFLATTVLAAQDFKCPTCCLLCDANSCGPGNNGGGACLCILSGGHCQTQGICWDGQCTTSAIKSPKNDDEAINTIDHVLVHDKHPKITVLQSCKRAAVYLHELQKEYADRGDHLDVTYVDEKKD